jgi:hypothetical protein
VIIQLAGLEAGSLSRLAEVDGVLEVRGDPSAEDHQRAASEAVTVTVRQPSSDAILRELLSWDGVQVTRVWPAARGPEPGDLARGSPVQDQPDLAGEAGASR